MLERLALADGGLGAFQAGVGLLDGLSQMIGVRIGGPDALVGDQEDGAGVERPHGLQHVPDAVGGQIDAGVADEAAVLDDRNDHGDHQHLLPGDLIGIGLDDDFALGALGELVIHAVRTRIVIGDERFQGDLARSTVPIGQEPPGLVRSRRADELGIAAVQRVRLEPDPHAEDLRVRFRNALQPGVQLLTVGKPRCLEAGQGRRDEPAGVHRVVQLALHQLGVTVPDLLALAEGDCLDF